MDNQWSLRMKNFPEKVFDGTHGARPEMSSVVPPEFLDYVILTREIAATQAYILNLAKNTEIMPDLDGILKEAIAKIEGVQQEVKKVTPPARLKVRMGKLEDKIKELDARKAVDNLRSELASLRDTIDNNQLQVLRLQDSFSKDVKGFQNRMLNMFKTLEQDATDRLASLEEKMSKVHLQAEVGNLLNRLEGLK
jgi:predicted  nucleic acid-binding Zn-ribbon protein